MKILSVFILAILILLLLFLIICFLPIYIKIDYQRQGQDDNFVLDFQVFFKFLKFKLELPFVETRFTKIFKELFIEIDLIINKITKYNYQIEKELDLKKLQLKRFKQLAYFLLNKNFFTKVIKSLKPQCKSLTWHSEYGLANPALTGISYGLFWSLIGIIITLLDSKVCSLNKYNLSIEPDFNQEKFKTHFQSIFSLWLGNIIITAFKIMIISIRAFFFKKLLRGT